MVCSREVSFVHNTKVHRSTSNGSLYIDFGRNFCLHEPNSLEPTPLVIKSSNIVGAPRIWLVQSLDHAWIKIYMKWPNKKLMISVYELNVDVHWTSWSTHTAKAAWRSFSISWLKLSSVRERTGGEERRRRGVGGKGSRGVWESGRKARVFREKANDWREESLM